uniref:Uncharacterized protein n=1 Tax=Pyxicephalus adspersus TaxID=30357 RepID=A0AAV2ZWC3_PYXAD|nr:TPA: hypothetical protein GDO54_016800 [Pyxicephalus adspersus]
MCPKPSKFYTSGSNSTASFSQNPDDSDESLPSWLLPVCLLPICWHANKGARSLSLILADKRLACFFLRIFTLSPASSINSF